MAKRSSFEAIETLQAMLDAMDPRFLAWDRERRKAEALRMAIVLMKKEAGDNGDKKNHAD